MHNDAQYTFTQFHKHSAHVFWVSINTSFSRVNNCCILADASNKIRHPSSLLCKYIFVNFQRKSHFLKAFCAWFSGTEAVISKRVSLCATITRVRERVKRRNLSKLPAKEVRESACFRSLVVSKYHIKNSIPSVKSRQWWILSSFWVSSKLVSTLSCGKIWKHWKRMEVHTQDLFFRVSPSWALSKNCSCQNEDTEDSDSRISRPCIYDK